MKLFRECSGYSRAGGDGGCVAGLLVVLFAQHNLCLSVRCNFGEICGVYNTSG